MDFSNALSSDPPKQPDSNAPFVAGVPVATEPGTGKYGLNDTTTAIAVPGRPILHGFELWVPPKPNKYTDGLPIYEIQGTDAQIVLFPLRAGRKIMCFSGAMCYMSDGMKLELKTAGFGKTFGRLVGGGSLFELTYSNETDKDGYIAMTPDYPGVMVPINMSDCKFGKIVALRDSFLCSTFGLGDTTTDVSAGVNPAQSAAGFCCSGVDFIVQTIEHGDWVFLMAMGTVIQKVCCIKLDKNLSLLNNFLTPLTDNTQIVFNENFFLEILLFNFLNHDLIIFFLISRFWNLVK
jgi:uncharacterized protein (AIM24 family)